MYILRKCGDFFVLGGPGAVSESLFGDVEE